MHFQLIRLVCLMRSGQSARLVNFQLPIIAQQLIIMCLLLAKMQDTYRCILEICCVNVNLSMKIQQYRNNQQPIKDKNCFKGLISQLNTFHAKYAPKPGKRPWERGCRSQGLSSYLPQRLRP